MHLFPKLWLSSCRLHYFFLLLFPLRKVENCASLFTQVESLFFLWNNTFESDRCSTMMRQARLKKEDITSLMECSENYHFLIMGSGWGIHVTPWLIPVSVWQNPLQYCEVISLQLLKSMKNTFSFWRLMNWTNKWQMMDFTEKCHSKGWLELGAGTPSKGKRRERGTLTGIQVTS